MTASGATPALIKFPPIVTKHADDPAPVVSPGRGGMGLALEMHTGRPLALAPRDADGEPALALHEIAYMGWWARRQDGEDLPPWEEWWPGLDHYGVADDPTRRRKAATRSVKKAAKPTS